MAIVSAVRVPKEDRTSGTRALRLPDVDDATLVERAQEGDGWAREAIFRKHVEYISALSVRLLRDWAEAEDVVQETFLDAFSHLHQLVDPERLRAWLAGIAVHKAHRRFRRRRWLALFGLRPAETWIGLEDVAHSDLSAEVRADLAYLDVVLSRLKEEVRSAWILRYVEGYQFDEISELCGCSLATAKRRVVRAHQIVRQHMDVEEDAHA